MQAKLVLENNTLLDKDKFLNLEYDKGTVKDYFNTMIAKIGENLILNDLLVYENENSNFFWLSVTFTIKRFTYRKGFLSYLRNLGVNFLNGSAYEL